MYKLTQKRLETLKSKKLAREYSKLNYLSYDTLFVKKGAVLFSEKIHKVGQFSVSRKSAKGFDFRLYFCVAKTAMHFLICIAIPKFCVAIFLCNKIMHFL